MEQTDQVTAHVADVAARALAASPIDLYDVTVRGGGRGRVVEVTVDRPGGISVDECADAARLISTALDADDRVGVLLDGPYRLDVSSPGAERPLRRRVDFERAVGMRARVKAEGAAAVEGVLTAVSPSDVGASGDVMTGVVTLTLDDGSTADVELDRVVRARTVLVWGASGPAAADARSSESRSSSPRRNAP